MAPAKAISSRLIINCRASACFSNGGFSRGLNLAVFLFVLATCAAGGGGVAGGRVRRDTYKYPDAGNSPRPGVEIAGRFNDMTFDDAYSVIFGEPSVSDNGRSVQLKLDKHSGSGFVSLENYMYGFFSASIKLPADYTAGVVLAFYTSNGDEYRSNHDELDFEFLGNVKGRPWRMQTNIYGNGSTSRGREERFNMWFDPTTDYHNYSILWNDRHILFLVDDVPVREMVRSEELGGDFPSKPMAVYGTLWDGSQWATDGGKYPVDYRYAPFIASFKNLKLQGCAANPLENLEVSSNPSFCTGLDEVDDDDGSGSETQSGTESVTLRLRQPSSPLPNPLVSDDLLYLSPKQRAAMKWVRDNHLYYSYCEDRVRYSVPLPECTANTASARLRKRMRRRNSKAKNSMATSNSP